MVKEQIKTSAVAFDVSKIITHFKVLTKTVKRHKLWPPQFHPFLNKLLKFRQ